MSATERIRYWANFTVKNLPAILTILSLLGFSVYSQTESLDKDALIEATKKQVAAVAEQYKAQYQPSVPRETRPVIIRQNTDNWGKYINTLESKLKAHERKYHGE